MKKQYFILRQTGLVVCIKQLGDLRDVCLISEDSSTVDFCRGDTFDKVHSDDTLIVVTEARFIQALSLVQANQLLWTVQKPKPLG